MWFSGLVPDEALVKLMGLLGMILVCAGVKVVAETCLSNYVNCSVCVRPIRMFDEAKKVTMKSFPVRSRVQRGVSCYLLE